MDTATIWGTVIFAIFLGLTYKRNWLSTTLFLGVLVYLSFVTIHFTIRFQNIVILKDVAAQVLGYSFILIWMAHILYKDGFVFTQTPLNKAVIVFFLLTVMSAYLAPMRFWYYSMEEVSRFAGVITFYFVVVNFCHTRFRWNIALYTLLGLTLVTSVYGYLQFNGYDWMSWGQRVNVSTFGNKDFFASFLTYGFPIALFMAFGATNWFDRVMYLLIVAAAMYNIITGTTRGAWVGIMALIGLTVLYELFFHGRLRQLIGDWKRQMACWLVIAALAAASYPLWPERYQHTFTSIFQAREGTNLIRMYMWWGAVDMLIDRPLVGQGVGVFQLAAPFWRPDRYHRIGMSHNNLQAHSEELHFLCEQGTIGFAAWLGFLAIFFYMGYKRLRGIKDMYERYLLYGILSAFFAGIVHDSMNVSLRWMSSTVVFWFVLAIGTRYIIGFENPNPEQARALKLDRPRGGWIAQAAIYTVVISAAAFMIYGQYRVLRSDYILNSAQYMIDNPQHREEGVRRAQEVLGLNPYDHSAYYKLSYAFLNKGDDKEAQQHYHKLLGIAPNYAQTHQNTGLILYQRFGNTGNLADLYPAIVEFEWATILENAKPNHLKMYKVYYSVKRFQWAQYHNRFIVREILEDQNLFTRYFYTRIEGTDQTADQVENAKQYYSTSYTDSYRDYFYASIELASQLGLDEERRIYLTKSGAERFPNDAPLIQTAMQEMAVQRPDNPYSQTMLANMLERRLMRGIPTGPEAAVAFDSFRQVLTRQIAAFGEHPLRLWLLGLTELELGNTESGWMALQRAGEIDKARFPFIAKRVERLRQTMARQNA